MPAALTAKGNEMREFDMDWDDISLIGPISPIARDALVEWLSSVFFNLALI